MTDDSNETLVPDNTAAGVSRRHLFQSGAALLATSSAALAGELRAGALRLDSDIYASIGVRPLINCNGVVTIVGGSLILPEVRQAMDEASRRFVHLDELADAVGARLADLTGAEWGMVSSGCAGAMTHATSACITGGDPEKLQRLPNLTGLKNEVVVPRYCRNVYDHAVRMLGVKMIEVDNKEELEAALSPRTAMIYLFLPNKEFGVEAIAPIAKAKGVPILVDCAAERLTIPNERLKAGATLVAYSGGKLLRGPQCAGLLLGRKDLVKAAWLNSAPHHAFGRPMKVGKEEMMGMLAAVEMWVKRDHNAEWKQWQAWADHMAERIGKVPGVTAEVVVPDTPVQPCPRVHVTWEVGKIGLTGAEAERLLLEGNPRIAVSGKDNPDGSLGGFTILPVMMFSGEEKSVAERVATLFSHPPKIERRPKPVEAASSVAGQWAVEIEFLATNSKHTFFLEQKGNELRGTHKGEVLTGDLHGVVEGNEVRFRSSQHIEGSYLNYQFEGKVDGDKMEGVVGEMSTITVGEYGQARWRAHRHNYGEPKAPGAWS
jgi:L-seryl-tRNA(Ser) seleniumtransferase